MKAEVVSMTADNLDMEAIRRGGDILKQGGLVAFPTETVYGLGGDALNPQASMKIYAAKGRPSDNPLIVHIAEFDKLAPIVAEVPEKAKILAEKYWPGPLTMIFPKSDLVPQETTGGLDSVAVRFPSDRIAQELIKAAGGYVAAPSANTSGSETERRENEDAALPVLKEGQTFETVSASLREGKTSPPKHYTEDTLLSAMENAGAEDMPMSSLIKPYLLLPNVQHIVLYLLRR